ncbi:23S rRNA (uracil(1939)-C(5))-methyltransferase RlmD [Marinobacterium zhoushanense]|uniref:23S rRNA (uracil(1939)-C(5))-methyltransferase RlmD n=1 Tax=Marinobacterium zhoushanense TaxID=1679163 RepID=A0ABQ1KMP9_9GAMM|nr:23S rRNA (uracil(1939)-C(5))-methyltransferase RlmD [Marinobacterium zhoushanense]GGC02616.1 23S rRNA (uracil(1939)-C(5))-methyltransferase RlmD [Marinobacterium zhoushanense]
MSRKRIRFGGPARQSAATTPTQLDAEVHNLSLDGRGVARVDGKTLFISGALPGERVRARVTTRHKRFDEAETLEVLQASSERQTPPCAYYGRCGGCQLQHLTPEAQIQHKERLVLDQLQRFANVTPEIVEPALRSSDLGYRRSARIGVNQRSDGELLIGFRRQSSNKLIDIDNCPVLEPSINALLSDIRPLLSDAGNIKHVTHLDISCGDQSGSLTLRLTRRLNDECISALQQLCEEQGFKLYLQGNDNQLQAIATGAAEPSYRPIEAGPELQFVPGDFLQVNAEINRQMVARAIQWLAPTATERVLDLFCGLGNFTLPLAQHAGEVIGIEGSAEMVTRTRDNASRNGLANVSVFKSDLSQDIRDTSWYQQASGQGFDLIVLDPPRAGAEECVRQLRQYGARAVLYIACNPASLVRDAQLLIESGYRMTRFAVMDMFPHTAHVESMALFEC